MLQELRKLAKTSGPRGEWQDESGKKVVELDLAEARVSASSQSNEEPLVDVKQVGDMTSLGL